MADNIERLIGLGDIDMSDNARAVMMLEQRGPWANLGHERFQYYGTPIDKEKIDEVIEALGGSAVAVRGVRPDRTRLMHGGELQVLEGFTAVWAHDDLWKEMKSV